MGIIDSMVMLRNVAALAMVMAYASSLPIVNNEVHQLHKTVLLDDSVSLSAMKSSYARALQSIEKYSPQAYDSNHYSTASLGHDALKAAMTRAHEAAKKVHALKEKMREAMEKVEAAEAKAAEKAKADVEAKAEADRAAADETATQAAAAAADAAA